MLTTLDSSLKAFAIFLQARTLLAVAAFDVASAA
jgi:hypothetical protein